VCRVGLEDCSDVSEGECIVLCRNTDECSVVSSEGINKIIAMDDNLLWTASSSSRIRRWRVPQRRAVRASPTIWDLDVERSSASETFVGTTPSKLASSVAESSPSSLLREIPSLSPQSAFQGRQGSSAPSLQDSMVSESWLRFQNREDDTISHGVPFRSLVKLTSPHESYTSYSFQKGKDPEVATLYSAASVVSVPRQTAIHSPKRSFIGAPNNPMRSPRSDDAVPQINTARADYEEREIAADATPLCMVPDDVIEGDLGLVRSIMFNDCIHAITVDASGEVFVWDIVRAVCRGKYSPEEVASASHGGSTVGGCGGDMERSPREALEVVRERIEGEAVVVSWSTVGTKTGVLTAHLDEKCFEGEVYADEVGLGPGPDRQLTEETRGELQLIL
jgi:WD repeat-containing protein 48